ncbi:hypothetical protein [Mesorhizobium sp.]|uniref:hypothetical protein n=1 Tax=Mesorhizobium sp. TaxID=1871066 RepID=UPI00345BFFDB
MRDLITRRLATGPTAASFTIVVVEGPHPATAVALANSPLAAVAGVFTVAPFASG